MGSENFSFQTLKVLKAFLEAFGESVRAELSGSDIMRRARLLSGTTYPILLRLEEQDILESRWEKQSPEKLGRPRRRLYRLTALGVTTARRVLAEVSLGIGIPNEA